ncbi:MAG TPA: hypothetical protein VKT82_01375 [Ktedonobacterales bacterium]|nr:hypothetical protein [Ktedonobacterales bacterium]
MMPLRAKDTALHWDVHMRPNAFGLVIAADPYQVEFTAELGLLRGGDGGVALHHGGGRLVQWLTLASAYWFRWPKPEVPSPYLRRAYSLFN